MLRGSPFAHMVLVVAIAACGHSPPAREPVVAPRNDAPAPRAPSPATAKEPNEPAEEGEPLAPDETFLVAPGDTMIQRDRRAIFRDDKGRLRARAIEPRDIRADEGKPVRIALGERAVFGAWDIRWIAVRNGTIELEASFRQRSIKVWNATTDERAAKQDLQAQYGLFTFEVRLAAIAGRADRADGRVELLARTTDLAPSAKYGETLQPGVYVFSDGLRVRVEKLTECDFDVSVPCPFGGSYRAHAVLADREEHVDLKARDTKILGRTLHMGRGAFFVGR